MFFHTGHHASTQALASEFTRQLDRQLSALSLLSAERLLEGIRTYRTQGRHPTSKTTRDARDLFMEQVVDDLQRVHQFSEERALAETARIDRALVVLHEPDQVTYGPSQPATTEGWPSLGHKAVNSSVGGQNRPMVAVLEQAALQVPPDQRPHVRLLVRAVLTGSPDLAQDLRHGQAHLEPRTQAQVSATSPRGHRGPPPTSPPPSPQATHPGTHQPGDRSPRPRPRPGPGPGSRDQASPPPASRRRSHPGQAPPAPAPLRLGRPRRASPVQASRPGR
ncbi:polymorphic toxin type 15 domain-containing protein [Actinomyces lilanjuaniae]|uniref:polymorphic toxin type 15 domain-containing protein n=1 Tax=Actinomyces lilanjuaniae TaxID=2321394 RepID=UPI0013C4DBE4|nr:polymorphic toxin type 15 domain-containing protein [Actinomyces lilanjuaniae]